MAVIPLNEPESFTEGDTVKWRRSLPDYLPGDGWTLTYRFGRADEATITVTGSDNGDQTHLISISPAVSATFVQGVYYYQASVSDGTDRYTVASGNVLVTPDFASVENPDTRTHARKVLDAIEAVLEERATQSQLSISVAGQSITMLSPEELIRWRSVYKAEVDSEERAERIQQGLGGKRIKTRFV